MRTLYSSSFVSLVFGFLLVMGYHNQPVEIVKDEAIPSFGTIIRQREPLFTDKVRIEVFDDLRCTRCADFALNTLPKIRNLEKETGEIELRVRFIPDINDEMLALAAMGLKCSGEQNEFWGMFSKLHENPDAIGDKPLLAWAKELNLDTKAFKSCVEGKKFQTEIESDIRYASEKMVSVKPTVIVNEFMLIGAQPFENIQRAISQTLKKREKDAGVTLPETATDLQQELKEAFQIPSSPTQPKVPESTEGAKNL
ncbi:thioredoxin domain-containing protein [Candidatus Peregrinibacteria bacterium]|nr:thioredoxin domain-containing protein [Candidatus Peregrinibacteria bacterium]